MLFLDLIYIVSFGKMPAGFDGFRRNPSKPAGILVGLVDLCSK